MLPSNSGEQAAFLNDLARRVTPSFDFFLFTLLAGLALLAALLIDSPALFVLAALLAPFMAPVVGLSFATILGSARFVIRMLGALVIATAVIFAWGALAGWLTHFLPPASYRYAALHGSTSWPDLLLLVLGAALTALALVRSPQQRPLVTSVAMAYELYLPAGAAGFSLTAGVGSAWPDGALVFLLHLSLAALTGALVLTLLGLRPLNAGGYLFGALLGLVALAGIVWINASALQPFLTFPLPAAISVPTTTTSPLPVMDTVSAGSATPPATPTITLTTTPSPTRTPTNTLVPTNTPTTTITPAPTAAYAFIAASQGWWRPYPQKSGLSGAAGEDPAQWYSG